MKQKLAFCAALALMSGITALAGPTNGKTGPIDVWTCPMTGAPLPDHHVDARGVLYSKYKSVPFGKYRLHFCCGNCPKAFAKLSEKAKQAKVASALKKDKAAAK